MRSTWYGCANMITNKIHITRQEYQNALKLGILIILVKLFVCPKTKEKRRTGMKNRFFRIIVVKRPY